MLATLTPPAAGLDAVESSVELLREFERTGRPEPFETFMRRHASMVYATCLKVTRDPHDAEDATQATFLTLASKSRLNGEVRQPEAWLRKVAHRLSLDLIRSRKRRVNRENLRSEMTDEAVPLDSHAHADKGEVKGILNEELAKLPAAYRMPLILHYFGGLSREEMAEQLKLKPSTLGVRLHRAREQLRRKLATRGIHLPTVALTALLSEVVRQGVCGHLMHATAQQASAIAMGNAASPTLVASVSGHDSIASLLALLSHGKLKVLLSALVVSAAVTATSSGMARLIPAAVREWLPTLRLPSLPSFEFTSPLPSFSIAIPDPAPAPVPAMPTFTFASATLTPESQDVGNPIDVHPLRLATPMADPRDATTSAPAAPAARDAEPEVVRRLALVPSPRWSTSAALTRGASSAKATAVASGGGRGRSAPTREDAGESMRPTPGDDPWNNVIPDGEAAIAGGGGGGGGGAAGGDGVDFHAPPGVPDRVVASVTGSVPALATSGGHRAGDRLEVSRAASDDVGSSPLASGAARRTTRTIVFDGTSANFGGIADADRAPTELANLDAEPTPATIGQPIAVAPAAAVAAADYGFNYPAVPGSVLSLNGARVTLRDATDAHAAAVSFVDTTATPIPMLPDGHHFIGVWQLDADDAYASADVLVRYDDLRAARLGLNERILKLWVSDGEGWDLMWLDPTFGRDADRNLLWVTSPGELRFFAVSAPEPAALTAVAAAIFTLGTRRRR